MIEKFANNVTKALYSNHQDPVGLVAEGQSSHLIIFLQREYEDLGYRLRFDTSRKSLMPSNLFTLTMSEFKPLLSSTYVLLASIFDYLPSLTRQILYSI